MPQDAILVTNCQRYADMRAGLNGGGRGADLPTGARVNRQLYTEISDSGPGTNVIQGAVAALQSSLYECYISG